MKTFAHDARPQPPRRAKLGDLFEQIVVRVEEERNARRKLVDGESCLDCGLDVSNRIGERKRQLLHRGRAGFANVITADRNRIPIWNCLPAERERVSDQSERWLRRKYIGAARDVFLENIV